MVWYYVEFIYCMTSSYIVDDRTHTLIIYACDLILCHPVKEHSLLIQFKHVAAREYSLNGWRYTYCPGVSRWLAKFSYKIRFLPLSRNCWIVTFRSWICKKSRIHYKKYEHGKIIYKYRMNQIVRCTIVWSLYFARLRTLKYVHVRCYLYFLNRIIYKMHCNKCLISEFTSNQNDYYNTHLWSYLRKSFKIQRKMTNIIIREWQYCTI